MDNNELKVGEDNNIKALDANELGNVAGGYQEYVHWKGWKKTYCDRCDQQITGPEQIGLSSADKKHHLCKGCVAAIQQMIPDRKEYYRYLSNNYDIKIG